METLTADQAKEKARPILSRFSISRTQQILLGILFAGATLRLWQLGGKSFWLDEFFSVSISQRGLFDLLRMVVKTDAHPPLYYLMLKFWLLFSQSEAWVRLLSVIFSTLSILLMYYLVAELYQDKRAGLLGAAILAFSPFQIWYAQEARMYAALTFFILASAFCFFTALRRGGTKYWIGYVAATTMALYIDNGAIWYLVTLVIFSLLSLRRIRGQAAGWLVSHLVIGFLFLFWLPFLYLQVHQVTQGFWLPPPSAQTVIGTFLDFQSYNFPVIGLNLLYIAVDPGIRLYRSRKKLAATACQLVAMAAAGDLPLAQPASAHLPEPEPDRCVIGLLPIDHRYDLEIPDEENHPGAFIALISDEHRLDWAEYFFRNERRLARCCQGGGALNL